MAVRSGVSVARRRWILLLTVLLAVLPACAPAPATPAGPPPESTVAESPPPTAAPPAAAATSDPEPELLIADHAGEAEQAVVHVTTACPVPDSLSAAHEIVARAGLGAASLPEAQRYQASMRVLLAVDDRPPVEGRLQPVQLAADDRLGCGGARAAFRMYFDAPLGTLTPGTHTLIAEYVVETAVSSDAGDTLAPGVLGRVEIPIEVAPAPPSHPDVIFYGGHVITMEPALPVAQALAVRGDRVLAVGRESAVRALAGPATRLIDLGGRALLPGFIDPHSHLLSRGQDVWGYTYDQAQSMALREGLTAMGELYGQAPFIRSLETFAREGRLRVRTVVYLTHVTSCGDLLGMWYPDDFPPGLVFTDRLRIGGAKLFADGGACRVPAASFDYLDPSLGRGDLFLEQAVLNREVAAAHAAGYQVAVHALGDAGLDAALEALERALAGQPNTPRHRIEHASLVRPDQIDRLARLGAIPTMRGFYPSCTGSWEAAIGETRYSWIWPWRTLLESAPHVTWQGDPPFGPIAPLQHLSGFVTRQQINADTGQPCPPGDWLTAETISVEQALRIMTIEAAYAMHLDEDIGSLRPGKLADLVILSESPLEVAPQALADLQVLATLIAGRVEWCAPGHAALCPAEG